MAIVTFWNNTEEQCGTTSSSIALATYVASEHNVKVLLISTGFNDRIVKDSFLIEKKKSKLSLFSNNVSGLENNGIEGLDRIIRSNRISPEIIKDYTQVLLTDRLEVLFGVEGNLGQYDLIKERYSQIIALASKYYDLVIVDLDNKIGEQSKIDILNESDIVISMISQRARQIEKVAEMLKENKILKKDKTIIAIGKYMEQTKYNAKNISRSILRVKDTVNTIPYNNLFFECSQEGKVVDLFIHYLKVKEKDENFFFQELKRLYETIQIKLSMR